MQDRTAVTSDGIVVASAAGNRTQPALLERDEVLRDLLRLVGRAREGDGHIVLLRGEAGIGKTALATALTRTVAQDTHVLWGWCDDLLAARPLGPVWDFAASEPTLSTALDTDDQGLVRQAVIDIFTRTHRPTVAVFEDVHWADGATLDLLTLVGRRIERTHTLLVLTFREVPADHPLRVVLGDLPASRVEHVDLQPLTRRAVATLAQDRDLAARVFDQTAGNPFFVSAVLATPDQQVPATVSDLVGSLMARLVGKREHLVQLVSVVPGRTERALLDEIDPDLLAAFDPTAHQGLLHMADQTVAFRHELARTAVEDGLPESVRRDLHQKVLTAGERLGFDAARLAHHARLAQDDDAMVRLLPTAARQAASRQSHREALSHLAALDPHVHRLPVPEQADLLELRATEEVVVSGHGLTHAMAAVELRRQLGDVAGLGAGLRCAARSAWAGADPDHAMTLAEGAVAVLQDIGGEELALAHAELARMAAQLDNPERAMDEARAALALARQPCRARALALATAGLVTNLDAYPDGSGMLEEAAAIAESLGLAWELQRARGNLVETALDARDLDTARRCNDAALASGDHDMMTTRFHVIMGAAIDTASGNYDAADRVLRAVVERERLNTALQWFVDEALAELRVRSGDPAASDAVRRVSRQADVGRQDHIRIALVTAKYLWVFGQRDDAATQRNLAVLATTADRAGPWALGELALWLWLDGHLDVMPDRTPAPLRWLGEGDWRRAADWFGEHGVVFEQAVALSRGDTDARLEGLRIAQRIGARALAARFRNQLRDDGVAGIPRGPRSATRRDPLGLTPRQGQVLGLLADGLSNADIAAQLFLSVRTVENHVSAILATLGVASREEAAAATSTDAPGAVRDGVG